MRRSFSSISTWPSSPRSGAGITCANDVWRRCAWSNGERRTSRCLPRSAFSTPYAFSPSTVKVADLRPASSPGLASRSSVLKPRRSAQRRYIRSTISVKSCASVPPELGARLLEQRPELVQPILVSCERQKIDVLFEDLEALKLLLDAAVLGR